jgi:hypothetical protein
MSRAGSVSRPEVFKSLGPEVSHGRTWFAVGSVLVLSLTTGTSLTVHTVCMKFHFAIHVCTLDKYPVKTAIFAINFMHM